APESALPRCAKERQVGSAAGPESGNFCRRNDTFFVVNKYCWIVGNKTSARYAQNAVRRAGLACHLLVVGRHGSGRFTQPPPIPQGRTSMPCLKRRTFLSVALALSCAGWAGAVSAAEPIKIGLITALSGQSALAGEAITRGMQVAIDEINTSGGLLGGRQLELVRRDGEANPAKGL